MILLLATNKIYVDKINWTIVDTCLYEYLKVASRVERRLNAIQNELRGDRDRHAYDRYDELLNLSTDLRQVRGEVLNFLLKKIEIII